MTRRDLPRTLPALAAAAVVLGALLGGPATAGAAPPWSAAARVPGSDGVGFPFDVAVGRDGTAAVAFLRDGVRVALRRPDGTWTAAHRVSRGRTGIASPEVAVDARGEVLVAWNQDRVRPGGPPRDPNFVRVAIRDPRGSWHAPRTVGTTPHFLDAAPRVAVDPRGDAVVLWRGGRPFGHRHDRLEAAYRPARGRFGREHSLGENGTDHEVALTADGHALAVWSQVRGRSGQRRRLRFSELGVVGRWSNPATLADGHEGGPRLAVPGDGSVVVVWRTAERGVGATRTGLARAATVAPGGVVRTTPPLSRERTAAVEAVVTPAGEVLAAWSPADRALDPASTGRAVLDEVLRPPGGAFGPVRTTPGVRAGSMAVLADGTVLSVWDGPGPAAAARPPGGEFGGREAVAPAGRYPVLAAGGAIAVTVWLRSGRLWASARGAPVAQPALACPPPCRG